MLKKYLKVAGISCLAIVMALTLTGCGQKQSSEEKRELVIWGFIDEDVFKPIIKDFKQKNKNLEVVYYKKTLDGNYENNALNSILSGQGPDVWAIPNDWVYRHKEKLAPMPEKTLTDKKIIVKDYFAEPIIQDNIFDNQIYGLAPTIDVLQIYYNPAIYESALENSNKINKNNQESKSELSKIFRNFPKTWGELNKIIPYLNVRNDSYLQRAAIAIGTSNNVTYSEDILSLLMLQAQTRMVSDDLTLATFNLPIKNSAGQDVFAGSNSLTFYANFADPSSPNYAWNSSMPSDVEAFVRGEVAMIFSYSNLAGYLQQIYPNLKFQQALIPQIEETGEIIDYASYTTYVVPEISPFAEQAWNFISFLSTDGVSTYKSATKELSNRKKSSMGESALKNRGDGDFQTEDFLTWNKSRYPLEVDSQFKQAIDRVNNRSQNSQASLDTAATNITELLRKEIW